MKTFSTSCFRAFAPLFFANGNHQPFLGWLLVLSLSLLSVHQMHAESIALQNADFEVWTQDTLPQYWYGSTSSIDSSAVTPSQDAYSGQFACCLVKTQKSHVRFSSEPFALKAGYYKLTYYAKGKGNIRNSYHKGTSYDAYTEYVELVNDGWKKIEYVFQVKADIDVAQLIFSVSSTSKEGVLIDALSLETTEKPNAIGELELNCPQISAQKGVLMVSTEQACGLQVYDVLGKVVLQTQLPQGLSSFELKPGMYLVSVGGSQAVQKIQIH